MIALCIHFKQKNHILLFLLCLSTFNTTPIAIMKTNKLVPPKEMNGNGKPVGGMQPVATAKLRLVCTIITVAIP